MFITLNHYRFTASASMHHRHERREDEDEDEFRYRVERFDEERRREHQNQGRRFVDVQGSFKHMHFVKHHGRYEHTVPESFFPNSEGQFEEPGGEMIVFVYPENVRCGDVLNIRY